MWRRLLSSSGVRPREPCPGTISLSDAGGAPTRHGESSIVAGTGSPQDSARARLKHVCMQRRMPQACPRRVRRIAPDALPCKELAARAFRRSGGGQEPAQAVAGCAGVAPRTGDSKCSGVFKAVKDNMGHSAPWWATQRRAFWSIFRRPTRVRGLDGVARSRVRCKYRYTSTRVLQNAQTPSRRARRVGAHTLGWWVAAWTTAEHLGSRPERRCSQEHYWRSRPSTTSARSAREIPRGAAQLRGAE